MADPISLYVHIPFCTAKCGYCDFNSYAGSEHLIPSYSGALVKEAELWRKGTAGRTMNTVFFGGGTPSLTPLDEMKRIMEGLRSSFDIAADAEISLEANPNSIDEPHLTGLLDLGFNRLSIGVQSLHDDELKSLDRLHSAAEAGEAFRAARVAGFSNISVDLMFGLPNQKMSSWQESVDGALALEPDHISLYALTVEEGTPLARDVARGRTPSPDPDSQADQYEWTEDRLAEAAYDHYEISNWAKPGFQCAHNLTYWHCREYLGLGAGAHSYLDGVRFAVAALPSKYLELVDESWQTLESGGEMKMRQVVSGETITPELGMADTLILGLRLTEGVSLAGFRERFDVDACERFDEELKEPFEHRLVEVADGNLRLTRRGRLLGNEVFARLLPD